MSSFTIENTTTIPTVLPEIPTQGDAPVGGLFTNPSITVDSEGRIRYIEESSGPSHGQDGVQISSYTKSNLPLSASDGTNALVTDGTIGGTPTMSYFYNGVWYRTFDNSVITNGAWSPSSISTRLWVDMDDQSTFTSSGGHVTTIADKSGNNYSFSAKAGATITAVNSAQNSKNVLRFDGNSDATTETSVGFTPLARHKWFFTVKVTGSAFHDTLLTLKKGNVFRIYMQNLDSDGVFPANWNVLPGDRMLGNLTNLLGQWVLLSAEFDVPNQVSSAWLNGTAYNSNVAQPDLTATNFTDVTVKLCENTSLQIQDADWGELIMTEDVSQSNSDKIEGYLAHKWGLTADLPSDHTYKTQAP